MTSRAVVLLYLLFLTLFIPGVVTAGGKGTSGAQFLDIPVGARAIGMGGAFVAQSDDASGIYYNPAALGFYERKNMLFHHDTRFFDNQFNYFSFNVPWRTRHGFGFGFTFQDAGTFDAFDVQNQRTGTFTARDFALSFLYGFKLNSRVALGGGVKLVRSKISSYDADALAGDFGLLFKPSGKLSLGLSARNVGDGIRFLNQKDELPFNLQAGFSYNPVKDWFLNLDVNKANDDDRYRLHVGTEYWFRGRYGVRVGWQDVDDFGGDVDGLTAGLGLRFPMKPTRNGRTSVRYMGTPSLNYAYIPRGDFGNTHVFSLGIKFGQSRGAVYEKEREIVPGDIRKPESMMGTRKEQEDRGGFTGRTIAVLDFRNTFKDTKYEWLRSALRDVIVSKLNEEFSIVSRDHVRKVANLVTLAGIPVRTETDFIRFGKFLEVDGLVAGAYMVREGKIYIEVGIYDVGEGIVRENFTLVESLEDVLRAGENLADRVREGMK